MAFLGWKERLRIPTYDDPGQVISGRVVIDYEKCNGCGMCASICPATSLYVAGIGKDKKAFMKEKEVPECMSCNDCAAICERDAITCSVAYDFGLFYKSLHRGELTPPRRF
jgi:MinD superfamily P-loop ATPase